MFFVVAVVTAVAAASAQSPFFKKCEDAEGVFAMSVTKDMLKKAGDSDKMDAYTRSIVKDKIDRIEYVTNDDDKGLKFLKKEIKKFNGKNGYEMLMNVDERDDGDNLRILGADLQGGRNRYVIISSAPSVIMLMILDGTLTFDDVVKCTKK